MKTHGCSFGQACVFVCEKCCRSARALLRLFAVQADPRAIERTPFRADFLNKRRSGPLLRTASFDLRAFRQ